MESPERFRSSTIWRLTFALLFTWLIFILVSMAFLWSLISIREGLMSRLLMMEIREERTAQLLSGIRECCSKTAEIQAKLTIATAVKSTKNTTQRTERTKSDGSRSKDTFNILEAANDTMGFISSRVKRSKGKNGRKPFQDISEGLNYKKDTENTKMESAIQHTVSVKSAEAKGQSSKDSHRMDMLKIKSIPSTGNKNEHIITTPTSTALTPDLGKDGKKARTVSDTESPDLYLADKVKKENKGQKVKIPLSERTNRAPISIEAVQDTSLRMGGNDDIVDDEDGYAGSGCDLCNIDIRKYIEKMIVKVQEASIRPSHRVKFGLHTRLKCRNATTDWNTTYNIGISKFLASHPMTCHQNEFLQSIRFKENKDEFFPLYRYEYRCCGIVSA